jgi:hypothetical protein
VFLMGAYQETLGDLQQPLRVSRWGRSYLFIY